MFVHLNRQLLPQSGPDPRKLRSNNYRSAAAAVEMALVSPILFAILLGTIEFGRAMMVSNMLTSTAREGARVAIVPGGANSDVTTLINSNLSSIGILPANATITVQVNGVVADASTANSGDNISIKVSVPYSKVTWLPTTLYMSSTSALSGLSVMRRE